MTLVDKYKALKEIDGGQSCAATAKKYVVAKNTVLHWLKKKTEIIEAVDRNNVSKRELDSAMCKCLKTAQHNLYQLYYI